MTSFAVGYLVGLLVIGFSLLFLLCQGPLFFGLVLLICGALLAYCCRKEINEEYN